MGLPTTTTGPTNVYIVMDDYGTSSGPPGGQTGGGSGNLVIEFTAPSLSAAGQVVHILSSGLQRPFRWGPKYPSTLPLTLMAGVGATVAITSAPSGIGF